MDVRFHYKVALPEAPDHHGTAPMLRGFRVRPRRTRRSGADEGVRPTGGVGALAGEPEPAIGGGRSSVRCGSYSVAALSGFVSGHGFSRAGYTPPQSGFRPCADAARFAGLRPCAGSSPPPRGSNGFADRVGAVLLRGFSRADGPLSPPPCSSHGLRGRDRSPRRLPFHPRSARGPARSRPRAACRCRRATRR